MTRDAGPVLHATTAAHLRFEAQLDQLRGALDLARNLYDATCASLGGPDRNDSCVLPGASYHAADVLREIMGNALATVDTIADSMEYEVTDAPKRERRSAPAPSVADEAHVTTDDAPTGA